MTLANAHTPIRTAVPMKPTALAALRRDDRPPTHATGTAGSGPHSFSTGFESPPDPLTDQVPTERRSPPKSHTDATTTK